MTAGYTLYHGDCVAVMNQMPAGSVDAIVTDPPYEMSFMGKAHDSSGISFDPNTWRACLRVLKPGGHLLSFGGARTSHRVACAIEDAGFEIRDSLAWLTGQGFPKSLNISKAIDKAAGADRTVVGLSAHSANRAAIAGGGRTIHRAGGSLPVEPERAITAPATDAARQWEGWGTALKPAHEPIVCARKPLSARTVAANVLEHGTGALNIDQCRISHNEPQGRPSDGLHGKSAGIMGTTVQRHRETTSASTSGRWPANAIFDESMAAELDRQSGVRSSGARKPGRYAGLGYRGSESADFPAVDASTGGPSRFFFVAGKDQECSTPNPVNTADGSSSRPSESADSVPGDVATSGHPDMQSPIRSPSTSERGNDSETRPANATPLIQPIDSRFLLEQPRSRHTQSSNPAKSAAPNQPTGTTTTTPRPSKSDGSASPVTSSTMPPSRAVGELAYDEYGPKFRYCAKAGKRERPVVNGVSHSTVKPLTLMRYLVRLITPPGGTVLDPFAGSGTTLQAARLEGFTSIGIESEADYLPLITKRMAS